jgi:hypothetical protein
MYAHIFKFNPNHDELGRFATSQGGNSARGTVFASPSIEGGTIDTAARMIHSNSHVHFKQASAKIDKLLGITGEVHDALGAWSDGAENSTVSQFAKADPALVRVAAAMRGLLGEQKAVIPFTMRKNGPTRLVTFDTSEKDASTLSKELGRVGLEYHTLVPTGKGYRVMVWDDSPTKKTLNTARSAASYYGALHTMRTVRGDGQVLGSWTDRYEGRKAYEGVIKGWASRNPTQAAKWNKIVSNWNFSATSRPSPI